MGFIDGLLEYWYIWVLTAIGGLIWHAVSSATVRAPGNALQQKFISLGTLKGKTLSEIESVCGVPSSVSVGANGVIIRQWMTTSYHIVLLFDKSDICLGVQSETKV